MNLKLFSLLNKHNHNTKVLPTREIQSKTILINQDQHNNHSRTPEPKFQLKRGTYIVRASHTESFIEQERKVQSHSLYGINSIDLHRDLQRKRCQTVVSRSYSVQKSQYLKKSKTRTEVTKQLFTQQTDKKQPQLKAKNNIVNDETRLLFRRKLMMIDRAIKDLKGNPEEAAIEYTKRLSRHLEESKHQGNQVGDVDNKLNKVDNQTFDQSKTVTQSSENSEEPLQQEVQIGPGEQNFYSRNKKQGENEDEKYYRIPLFAIQQAFKGEGEYLTRWQKVKRLIPLISIKSRLCRRPMGLYERNFQRAIIKRPYEHDGAFQFFTLVKQNQIDKVKSMLSMKPYLVNDIDHTLMTPLHMAAFKGFYQMSVVLINFKCEIDAVDSAKKTPLYYALHNGHLDVAKLYIKNQACPWSDEFCNYKIFQNEPDVWHILRVARRVEYLLRFKLHILMAMVRNPEQTWKYFKQNFLNSFQLPPNLL